MKKNAGKAPAVMFYFKDFFADMAEIPNEIVGAWIKILCKIWHEKTGGKTTKTIEQWSRLLGESKDDALRILDEIQRYEIGDVTQSNAEITVLNRRTARDCKLLELNAKRQQDYRDRQKKKDKNNGNVTQPNVNPSYSVSYSVSNNTIQDSVILPETNNKKFTLNEVLTEAVLIGIPEDRATDFFHYYNAQGWKFGNNVVIESLSSAMVRWKKNEYKFDKKQNENGTVKSKAQISLERIQAEIEAERVNNG